MADAQDPSGQHAEGIQHIASNTAPPGTQDTARGTEGGVGTGAESGGVSSSSAEQEASQGGVIDTVKSYLGMGNGTGTTAAETGQLGSSGDSKNAQDAGHPAGSGSGAGFTGTLASAASAVGMGSGNQAAGGGLGSTSSSSAEAAPESSTYDNTGTTGSSSQSTVEAAKEKVQEVTNTGNKGAGEEERKESTSGDNDHKPPQPADGKPKKLENPTSIPTAGGERLGEKHWGESGIVPDNPQPRASDAGISSEEGQPTQQTSDNTAKNTGGATGPPGSDAHSAGSGGSGEEKTKMTDKIKDKLHMGKKE